MAQSSFRPIPQPQGARPVVDIRAYPVRPMGWPELPSNAFEAGAGLLQQAVAERELRRQRNVQTPNPADPWRDMRQENVTFGGRLRSLFGGGQ